MRERGQFVQDYQDTWSEATEKRYIVYAAQLAGGDFDPQGEYYIDHVTIQMGPGTDTGTIQFYKENVETNIADVLSGIIPVDEAQGHLSLPVEWRPGPLHDVYFVTTGTAAGFVSLRTHRVSNSFAASQEIIP